MTESELQMLEVSEEIESLTAELQAVFRTTICVMQDSADRQQSAMPKIRARTHRMAQVSYYGTWNGDLQNPKVEIWRDGEGNALVASFRLWKVPKRERPQCGARCRDGHACNSRVVVRSDGSFTRRCRLHGGKSTGPKTAEGRARIAESNRRRAKCA